MGDILKSIKAYLYDRSSSPLFGAFVVSWLAWNYRFIVALSANASLTAKFEAINQIFSQINLEVFGYGFWFSGGFIHGFAIPLFFAYVYLYLYPLLAKPVYEYSLKKQIELRGLKQKVEDNRLLSLEESRELHRRLALLQGEFDEETAKYQRELSNLREIVAQSEKNQDELSALRGKLAQADLKGNEDSKAINAVVRFLRGDEERVLKIFAGKGDHDVVLDLAVHRQVGGQIDVVRVILDDLVDKGLLRYAGTNERGAKLYTLQPAGRRYLVTNLLEVQAE